MLKLGQILSSLRGWFVLVTTLLPAVATFITGLLEDLPWSQRILFMTAALTLGAALAFYVLRGYELVTGWYGARKESLRAARQMADLRRVGQTEILIGHAADIWSGSLKTDTYSWIVRLRQIKQAADLGLVGFSGAVKGQASKHSAASVEDLERFFRQCRWKELPPLGAQKGAPPKSPVRHQRLHGRSNWVTGWRDRW